LSNCGNSELYDLNIDPYETTNLMERSLTNTQQTALEEFVISWKGVLWGMI